MEQATTEPRTLNTIEKRRLEKVIIGDIDQAMVKYNDTLQEEREELIEKLKRTPAAEPKALQERYLRLTKELADTREKLDDLGYRLNFEDKLDVNVSTTKPKALVEFDERMEEMRQKLLALKRSYVIKLFAGHVDTENLFAALATDLERIIG